MTIETPKFVFLLNAMENAACQENPQKHDYSGKRLAVRDYASKLETELITVRAELKRVKGDGEMLDWLTRQISGKELRRIGIYWPAWSPEYARAGIRAALKPAEEQKWIDCEDCNGQGVCGNEMWRGDFQPPERERCQSCNGSGKWPAEEQSNEGRRD